MKENNDREIFTYTTTNGNLNKINSKNESSIISDKVNSFSEEEQNNELINREIPININNISEIRSKTNLSIEQERIIQKLPTFRMGDEKIHDEIINSDKYLEYKEYKPLIIRNPPLFFWFIGLCFISFDILIIINIILYQFKKNFISGFIGKYAWEFIIIVIILLFGISFFIYSEYESINIDLMKGKLTLYKYNTLTCSFNILEIQVNSINSIFPAKVETPRSSSMRRSCLTQIGITFNNSNTVYLFRTLFRYFTIKNVIKLRTFLYKRLQSYDMVSRELEGTVSYINVLQERI
jgi:hypothetical protein